MLEKKIQTVVNKNRRKNEVAINNRWANEFKKRADSLEENYLTYLNKGMVDRDKWYERMIKSHREGERVHREAASILSRIGDEKLSSMSNKDFDKYKYICRSKLDKIVKQYKLDPEEAHDTKLFYNH